MHHDTQVTNATPEQVQAWLAAGEILLVDVLSLLPGTLSVDLRGTVLTLHVLDERTPAEAELRVLEGLIAAMFRVPLNEEASTA
jgi:multicomponent Na+:H+ antiporter subunit E